jgi:hypothetical protein
LSHLVAPCPFLLGEGHFFHLHTLISALPLPSWLFDPGRKMDDRPPIFLAEWGCCRMACEAGRYELLLLLAPLTVDLLSLRLGEDPVTREKPLEMITFTFCFGLVTIAFKNSGQERGVHETHTASNGPSVIHLWSNENLEKLIASSYSRAIIVSSLLGCYLGALTTQAIEHHWGLLARVCHGNLTADGMSSAVFRAIGLRCLSAILGASHTQPGRARVSGAVLTPVSRIDWDIVPTLARGCNAALDLYALALGLDPCAIALPRPFGGVPRDVVWRDLGSFLAWLPEHPRKGLPAISSSQLPITSLRGRGGIRADIQLRQLAAAGRARSATPS